MSFTLYSRPNSSNCQKVLWLAEEIGLQLHVIPAGMKNELNKTNPAFLAMNPTGLVPLLEHKLPNGDVFRIDESNTILRYLAAVNSSELGGGKSLQQQAKISRWMDFVISAIEVAMKPVYFHEIRGVKLSDVELAKAVQGAIDVFALVEKFLQHGQPYLAGDFSIADICIGAQLHRYFTLHFERPKLELLAAYYERLKTRKSYQTLVINEKCLCAMQDAIKRLARDLEEIKKTPLPTVTAAPLEHNMFVWHANVLGMSDSAYSNAVFHLELSFPLSYPNEPPSVTVLTPIPHPHVHGSKVCLDLLSDFDGYFKRSAVAGSFTGWSPAYSVLSILLQLQAFLHGLDDEEDGDERDEATKTRNLELILTAIPNAIKNSREYKCAKCSHKAPNAIWPPILTREDLMSSVEEHRGSLICFHTKKNWEEDCLGLGLRIERNKSGKITSLYTGLDIVSWTAYNSLGVRNGVIADEKNKYTHWIPLWINYSHGTRALTLFRQVVSFIFTGRTSSFRGEMGFEIVQKLMNHFVVQMMKGDVFASENALVGYCYFHRWLLILAELHPDVLKKKVEVVENFIRFPEKRLKTFVPDLGEFLTLISLDIPVNWNDVKAAYLGECYSRNSLWIVRQHPELANTRDSSLDRVRPELSFRTNRVSLHLCLFHICFLKMVARPPNMSGAEVANLYDVRLGRPSSAMRNQWQSSCRELMKVDCWDDYFRAIDAPVLSRDELNAFLKQAIENSPYVNKEKRSMTRR